MDLILESLLPRVLEDVSRDFVSLYTFQLHCAATNRDLTVLQKQDLSRAAQAKDESTRDHSPMAEDAHSIKMGAWARKNRKNNPAKPRCSPEVVAAHTSGMDAGGWLGELSLSPACALVADSAPVAANPKTTA